MSRIPIEIVEIGFSDTSDLMSAVSFVNQNQDYFLFSLLKDSRFSCYDPENHESYQTIEIYKLFDNVFKDLKGFHNLVIGIVNRRLDGKTLGNLFGSMETNDHERITGKAITSIYGVENIIEPLPVSIYYCIELLSISIRFIVGKGMIHDGERGCLFHRKINKTDIIETIQSGYISLDSLKVINKYLEFEQIQYIQGMLTTLAHIARSENPRALLENSIKESSMSLQEKTKPSIFVSYSHKDSEWLNRLQVHMKPFELKGLISPWDDTKIKPGMIWKDEIIRVLDTAKVAILLVSADFLASDFIIENELPPLLASAKLGGTSIFPVILKPCSYEESDIGKFQAFNSPLNPVIKMSELEQEELFVEIVRAITETIGK